MNLHKPLSLSAAVAMAAVLGLTACGGDGGTANAAPAVSAVAPAAQTLKPNERLQGTIELDIGKGAVAYRSIATTVSADLGKQTAERLNSGEGQQALNDANARLKGDVKVQASDVQALADQFAGKTLYTTEMRDLAIIQRRALTIAGTAADGAVVQLSLGLAMADNRLESATLEFVPDGKQRTQSFTSKDAGPVEVSIERFEQIDADTWSIAGRYSAAKLVPGVLAKKLAGQTVEAASGRFDVTEVAVRPAL